jgi:NAD(P)-dependent dehydrogenase (short-subunit alcohol dehydrogenase family)
MASPTPRSVLVTGASGGIGRATVIALRDQGYTVWAATRTVEAADALATEFGSSIKTVAFDVTDGAAVSRAATQVAADGPLFAVVNNAGGAFPGPLELVPIEQFQHQLDVNLTGQLRTIQALLPAIRAGRRHWGDARIVMMGSLDARVVGPLFGPYAASKHGLVGLSDALRSELHPAGISVVLLEPGVIDTAIWDRGLGVLSKLQDELPDRGGPYRSIMDFAQRRVPAVTRHGASPDRVARAVVRSLDSARPRPRRAVGVDANLTTVLLHLLPPRVIYRLTALPRLGSARSEPAAAPRAERRRP